MAHSLSFLLSSDAAQQRMVERKPSFVVHVEVDSDLTVTDRFQELDADDLGHAHDIASSWVHKLGNVSAAVRRVFPDGQLSDPVGRIIS